MMKKLDVKHFLGIYQIRLSMQDKEITNPSENFKKWTREFVDKLSKMPPEEEVTIKKHSFLDSKGNIIATFPINSESSFTLKQQNEENMKYLINKLKELRVDHDVQEFDSGAVIIDLSIKGAFYCIQIAKNKIGYSKISDEPDFSTVPDSGYLDWKDFLIVFEELITKNT